MLDREKLLKRIEVRQKKLEYASKNLKEHFVGIDTIIDKIFQNIKVWYLLPEILTRPMIICLWGLTGVGKTDLVRRLVKLLDYSDRFSEIELSGDRSISWYSSISSLLNQNPNIISGRSNIILLDEIQRFRTIDEFGKEIKTNFADVWSLLSDGKLPHRSDLEDLWYHMYDAKRSDTKVKEDSKSKEPKKEEKWSIGFWGAKRIKKELRLEDSLETILSWDQNKIFNLIKDNIDSNKIYEYDDYSKSLIFISGNLDEAYQFADETGEVDVDADVFYSKSLRLNVLDIKKALKKRFKPEQIARFGNIHVLYPSLSKKSYEGIIRRKIKESCKDIEVNFGIKVEVDESILSLIYKNGVFPVQGTRPVFSTIQEVFDANLPYFLFKAFVDNKNLITMSYKDKKIFADISGVMEYVEYVGTLDEIKAKNFVEVDKRALVSVHESGHAIVYAVLRGKAPTQIISSTIDNGKGFMTGHSYCKSKKILTDELTILLAGRKAEEIIFGSENITSGASADLSVATSLIAMGIRTYGLHNGLSVVTTPHRDVSDAYNTNIHKADNLIEKILQDSMKRASKILSKHYKLFKEVADELFKSTEISSEKFQKICRSHNVEVAIVPNDYIIYPPYSNILNKYNSK